VVGDAPRGRSSDESSYFDVMPQKHDAWPEHVVEGVADILGDTTTGLTGSEIGTLLARSRIADISPGITKRHRLREALLARQSLDRAANCVIRFVTEAMEPVRYRNDPASFTLRQDGLNEVLVFLGLRVNDEGRSPEGRGLTL
jgi:hypothetical protein